MESDVHLSVEAQKLWNATLKSLKQMRDPRKSMQDVMSFHAASVAFYVPSAKLSSKQWIRRPLACWRFKKLQHDLKVAPTPLLLAKADDLLSSIEFNSRRLVPSQRHRIRQACVRKSMAPRTMHLAFTAAGIFQTANKVHMYSLPNWLHVCAGALRNVVGALIPILLLGTAWSIVANGQLVRETFVLGFLTIYTGWMTWALNVIGPQWQHAQNIRMQLGLQQICNT